jgi:hypothetical protein
MTRILLTAVAFDAGTQIRAAIDPRSSPTTPRQ